MKKLLLLFALLGFCRVHAAQDNDPVGAARAVIARSVGHYPDRITLRIIGKAPSGCDRYTLQAEKGRLQIGGSSTVALCKAFHDYALAQGYGIATWSGSRFELPKKFPDMSLKEVVSPFRDRLFFNVCTFGYTMPFWEWDRWEQELDWLALHGFDMPLAPVGGEAILARVWRSMGLTDAEIDAYFTGPAHMPWMRMGNMTELDGAPTQAWHDAQIALQHKILDRMRELGMKPVYQGFAGFVPQGMKRLHPETELTETKWSGLRSWLLSPLDPLFSSIGTAFVKEWEKEFGKGDYYLIDCFNELDVPFGEHGTPERAQTLRNYSSTIYKSLSDANPGATWMMQGWMFGYQRHIWDPFSVEALLSGVPDGKMTVIDLAVDFNNFVWRSEKSWNFYNGFYGKDWIFSTVPNFGGRTALTGVMEFYANGHLEALASPNKGGLTGFGCSPEGTETNDAVYELISAAGWSDSRIDVQQFLNAYSRARYGAAPKALDHFWQGLQNSVYGEFTNNARFKWQFRPYWHRMPTMGINDDYFRAIESFLSCSDALKTNENYRTDAVQYAALYLAGKADILLEAINWAYVKGDAQSAETYEARFREVLRDADRLLASHPILRLDRWCGYADRAGYTPQEKARFVSESKRLISTWGGPSLYDYSPRVWSGVIRDFYLPRWEQYFDAKHKGTTFDFRTWDEQWHTQPGISSVEPYEDPLAAAVRLVAAAGDIIPSLAARPADAAAFWSPFEFGKQNASLSFTIGYEQFNRMKGIRISNVRGSDPVTLTRLRIRASHHDWAEEKPGITITTGMTPIDIPVTKRDVDAPQAKEFTVTLWFKGPKAADNYAAVELIY